MIEIDGSQGEGGGQMLRSALSLSVLTGQSVRFKNIRSRRSKPGLRPQHLKAVEAAASISAARLEGAVLSSQSLSFEPQTIQPGEYRFDIGTAGAVTLVAQTVLLPLSCCATPSHLVITGGTHVPWSPCFHYLSQQYLPYLGEIGFHVTPALERAGFYPPGGGIVSALIRPHDQHLRALKLDQRGALLKITGLAAVSNLDVSIAERMRARAQERIGRSNIHAEIEIASLPAVSKGAFLQLLVQCQGGRACYTALGAPGKPAEVVADEAVRALEAFLASGAAIDEHLADQLLLPLAMAPGHSTLHTACITQHLETNADIIRRFLPAKIDIDGARGQPGLVRIAGMSDWRPIQRTSDTSCSRQ
jgi:RNA 3'-phosphate cyclase